MAEATGRFRTRVRILGITQGVGFRPFVWRLAQEFGLSGWVQNDSSGLLLEVQGATGSIDGFLQRLADSPPTLAQIDAMDIQAIPAVDAPAEFLIRESQEQARESSPVTQDISVCADCLRELQNPQDRRHGYAFINCTNCGPRFTIVENLPYDRSATTMKSFSMCQRCQSEYDDPSNRRFHAQPNACPDCGPCVWFVAGDDVARALEAPSAEATRDAAAIRACKEALMAGKIIATKGIGGFHLVCSARNTAAVAMLRQRKGRVDKPFAIMVADVAQAREMAEVSDFEAQILSSRQRPIVLLSKSQSADYAAVHDAVAPGNGCVGLMLPYSPLHQLLVETHSPLVVTSGNLTDEPIVRSNQEASSRLTGLADCFLLHNRDIHAVCDDSVVRCISGRLLPIRRSRGFAPMPVRLRQSGPGVLAVGGELKATFCVTKQNCAYMSQHIGDVSNWETLDALERNVEHFLKLFRVELEAVVGDLHPEYLSSRWAQQFATRLGIPYLAVQHHAAHAASLMGEQPSVNVDPILACCFDGTGYGSDGAIWGGEFMLASPLEMGRIAHLKYFPLPGGDSSIKRPYRIALALLKSLGLDWDPRLPSVAACTAEERGILSRQMERNLNCVATSSMGRLFDAVASLLGVRQCVSYEAQAAMELEAASSPFIADVDPKAYSFDVETSESATTQIGCAGLLQSICSDVISGLDHRVIGAQFHHAVGYMILEVSEQARRKIGLNQIGLTGGVFQNALLMQLAEQYLREAGFQVLTHSVVPPNDGGLALGQAVIARHRITRGRD